MDNNILKDKYKLICKYDSEILRLQEMKNALDAMLSNFGNMIPNNKKRKELFLKLSEDIIDKKVASCDDRNVFCDHFYASYSIKCDIKTGIIICEDKDVTKLMDSYNNTLSYYETLLEENDFNYSCYKVLYDYYRKIRVLVELLHECFDFIIEQELDNFVNMEKEKNYIESWMIELEKMKKAYEELLSKFDNQVIDTDVLKYILNNTSLISLVATNNGENQFKKSRSLNRKVICQFHEEKTPSMIVSIDENKFYCCKCDAVGNQVGYLMLYENLSHLDAVYLLSEIFYIDLENNPFKSPERFNLVEKYRNYITSEEFMQFLLESYEVACQSKSSKNEIAYQKLFDVVERVKTGIYDSTKLEEESPKQLVL